MLHQHKLMLRQHLLMLRQHFPILREYFPIFFAKVWPSFSITENIIFNFQTTFFLWFNRKLYYFYIFERCIDIFSITEYLSAAKDSCSSFEDISFSSFSFPITNKKKCIFEVSYNWIN